MKDIIYAVFVTTLYIIAMVLIIAPIFITARYSNHCTQDDQRYWQRYEYIFPFKKLGCWLGEIVEEK